MTKPTASLRTRAAARFAAAVVCLAALAGIPGILRGSMPDVPTGTWVATAATSGARGAASAVLMPEGGLLVTGGGGVSEAASSVELFGSDGTFSAVAAMNEARSGHTAVLLKDGRVLVIGGRNDLGAVSRAEIFADGSWTLVSGLTDARWGHTATVLKDGRVLVAGGENSLGAVMSLELYDPGTDAFSVTTGMAVPRRNHAAALLTDGRVILAGGSTDDAVLATTEIFDPETLQLSAGPSLNQPRFGLTATGLLDGRVVFIGGHNGTSNLASAEIYSDVTNAISYTAATTPIVPRRGHQAFLLPNNNAVLIVGGIAEEVINGAVVEQETSAAELFLPWLNEVWLTGGMTVPRSQASGAALSAESYGAAPAGEGLLVVLGGAGEASSEAYRFATIRTDKDDYAPGEQVYVSGSGWQPNETVTFALRELPAEHASRTFDVMADELGRIERAFLFDVEAHHLGVRFYLVGRGAASQAQVTFTDGNVNVRTVGVGVAATIQWARYPNTTCSGSPGTSGTISAAINGNGTAVPGGASSAESLLLTAPAVVNAAVFQSWTGGISTPPPDTSNPICVAGTNPTRQIQVNYTATVAATLVLAPATGTYGGTVSLSATLSAGSSGLPGKTIVFTLNGNTVGSAVTDASGAATLAGVSLAGIDAGIHPSGISASFAGDPTYEASNSSASLTVSTADQTITFDALTGKAFGDAPFSVSASATSGLAVSFSSTTPATCTVTGSSVSMTAAGTCTIRASQGGDDNYNAASDVDQSFTIDKATPIVTATGGVFGYTGTPHAGSGAAVGIDDAQLSPVTLSYNGTGTTTYGPTADAPTSAGTYAVTASFAGDDQYASGVSSPASLTINKASAQIDVQGTTVTYDGQSHGATGTAVGVLGETLAGLDLGASFTNVPGGSANWTFTDVTGNYNNASGSVAIVINKAAQTITWATPAAITYGTLLSATQLNATVAGVTGGSAPGALSYSHAIGALLPANLAGHMLTVTAAETVNYTPAMTSVLLIVNKATLIVTAQDTTKLLNAVNPVFTAGYSGFVNGETLPTSGVTGEPNLTTTALTDSPVGQYPINAAVGTLSAQNYQFSFVHGSLKVLFAWGGFLQPITDTAHDLSTWSRFKAGQTIPVKFQVMDANGIIVQQTQTSFFSYRQIGTGCGSGDTVDLPSESASSVPVYAWTGSHYQYNWSTKSLKPGLYMIYAHLSDTTVQEVSICLTR